MGVLGLQKYIRKNVLIKVEKFRKYSACDKWYQELDQVGMEKVNIYYRLCAEEKEVQYVYFIVSC